MQNWPRPDKMHFDISVESLVQVHCLRSVDNLLVVVQEFKDPVQRFLKKEILKHFEEFTGKCLHSDLLKEGKVATCFKGKKKCKKINQNSSKRNINNQRGDKIVIVEIDVKSNSLTKL